MNMIKLTSIKIQDNVTLRGALASEGLDESVLSTPRVLITEDAVHAAVHAKMSEALEGIMGQIAEFAETAEKDGAAVMQAMQNNIESFRLDAGGGYTTARKAELIADESNGLVADSFVPPKKGGAVSTCSATMGTLTL